MKVWFNRISESRRSLVELEGSEFHIGRDDTNDIVLTSPLVSREHAIVRVVGDQLELENCGINSCLVGESEISGGKTASFTPGTRIRIWPYTLSFQTKEETSFSQSEIESHLRSQMVKLELEIHKKLLERLDLYEFEGERGATHESIILLENNIEDVCRDKNLFGEKNEALLEEITGITLRDQLVNQIILETGEDDIVFDLAVLTSNEFDIPATLVPERETELHSLLTFIREKMKLDTLPDVTSRVRTLEKKFGEIFHLVRPHLHGELRKYLILRAIKKDLKDTVFGFGPLQDLLRAPTITEIMVVKSDQIFVERDGIIENSGRRFLSEKVTEAIIERIVAQVGRRIDKKSQPAR